MPDPHPEFTNILLSIRADSPDRQEHVNRAFDYVYNELRRVAGGIMQSEKIGHTLQPTALVHEAYCRLVDQKRIEWQNRAHFFWMAARAMRQILVDHARSKAAAKRGGGWQQITLDEQLGDTSSFDVKILDLDGALTKLAEKDKRMAKIVELRVFGNMPAREVAHVLGISKRTVLEDWRVAKMWLARELFEETSS
jgi:RNA polymerase sigma factor (TIGR02999 family)